MRLSRTGKIQQQNLAHGGDRGLYRKKYRQGFGFTLVTCHDCGKFFQNLILITEGKEKLF